MAGTVTASIVKNDTTSPPQFQDSTGTEVGQLCRAWVNFNGTTASPSTIRASFNVSSVTKSATGTYTVNFTNALADANYSILSTNDNPDNWSQITSLTASGSTLNCRDSGTTLQDATIFTVAIFR